MIATPETFYRLVRVDADGCHRWTGALNIWGYGRLRRSGKSYSAHRVAWELANGLIPDGQFVLHHCDNRSCVNPAHLFLGSQLDNVHDMWAKGRAYRRKMQMSVSCDPPVKREVEAAARFEFRLPSPLRQRLDEVAGTNGISASDLARLAIGRLLANPEVILKFSQRTEA